MRSYKQQPEALKEGYTNGIPDIITHHLTVLFCGINPGVYSAATGHHFGKPGNRFWKALYMGGFTDYIFSPVEDRKLLTYGLGITNFVQRPTIGAKEIQNDEYRQGAVRLRSTLTAYSPRWLGVIGIEAYRKGFRQPAAQVGLQTERINDTKIWVLPNTTGLNAHYTMEKLGELFREFNRATTA